MVLPPLRRSGGAVTFAKAALFDTEGRQIAVAKRRTPMLCGEGGKRERDMVDLREAIFSAVREAVQTAGVPANRVAAVGLSGHGKGLYLLDKAGKPFQNAILSVDSRAQALCERMKAEGAQAYARERHFQNLLACQPVCLLRWLKEHDGALYRKIGTVFSAKDYIRYCLTGEIAAEITDVSGTNLLDLQTKTYDTAFLERIGIGDIVPCLPPVIASFPVAGYVNEAAAQATGLCKGTPVGGGMFDIDAGGLTNSEVWVQLFADILQLPVEIPADGSRELGCFGAAVAAGAGAGVLADAHTFLSSLARRRVLPDPALRETYERKYGRYLQLVEAMKLFWKK